jgi:hypothetical protein
MTNETQQNQSEIDRLTNVNVNHENYSKKMKSEYDALFKEHTGLKNFNDGTCRENENLKIKLDDSDKDMINMKYKLREFEQKNKVLTRQNN